MMMMMMHILGVSYRNKRYYASQFTCMLCAVQVLRRIITWQWEVPAVLHCMTTTLEILCQPRHIQMAMRLPPVLQKLVTPPAFNDIHVLLSYLCCTFPVAGACIWNNLLLSDITCLLFLLTFKQGSHFPRLLESTGKCWIFIIKSSRTWKVLEIKA